MSRSSREASPSSGRFMSYSWPLTREITERLARDLEMASAIESGVEPSGYSRLEPSGNETLIIVVSFVLRRTDKALRRVFEPATVQFDFASGPEPSGAALRTRPRSRHHSARARTSARRC